MTNRRTPLALNEYYHIYSRGVDKRRIFLDANDEKRFIKLLFLCNGSKAIVYREVKNRPLLSVDKGMSVTAVGAYCLMPNHFHLLVKETTEKGVSKFMSKLLTAYSTYFNRKYGRVGVLFSSEFKSEHLDTDEYLKYLFSYIHLNPLRLKDPNWKDGIDAVVAEGFLDGYRNSSYLDYAGHDREESCILNRLAFPEYFPDPNSFKKDLFSWFIPTLPSPPLG